MAATIVHEKSPVVAKEIQPTVPGGSAQHTFGEPIICHCLWHGSKNLMAYDQELAERIRAVLPDDSQLAEKEMFGGICFLRDGSMFCGIIKEDLMVRVGPDAYEAALENVHAREMDFTGRPMKGYVMVEPEGFRTAAALSKWVQMGYQFVATKLKPKKTAANRSASRATQQNSQVLPQTRNKKRVVPL